ncbi:pilin N-terminal domain-containing protein [uncultured Enterococcus sp.]|uniref:pilin N-terminal domain-containing protein n=1 Tax=uncultured Enterococcus sp. TaxID=167972 RepID=UPI0025D3E34B|nr:pilin N-terminal domain-containing protein [uncultured Enterococcus sp.]
MKKQAFGIITTAMLILPLVAGTLDVQADEVNTKAQTTDGTVTVDKSTARNFTRPVNIQLHALKYNNATYNAEQKQQNNGVDAIKGESTPVSKVAFDIYDISEYYNNGQRSQEELMALYNQYKGAYPEKLNDLKMDDKSVETDEDGLATIANLPVTKDGKFTAYLILQSGHANGVYGDAAPMIVTMPDLKPNSTTEYFGQTTNDTNDTINLYPKFLTSGKIAEPTNPTNPSDPTNPNQPTAGNTDPKDPSNPHNYDKDGKQIDLSVDYNEKINFGFDVTVPDRTKFNSNDPFTITVDAPKLTIDDKTVVITYKDKEGTLHTVKQDSNSFDAKFENGKLVIKITDQSLANQDITISYSATVPSGANPNEKLTSKVTLDNKVTDNEGNPITYDLKNVYTGGNNFQVVDASNDNIKVNGGSFYLQKTVDGSTKYAKLDGQNFTGWTANKNEATIIKLTDNQSVFAIKGLKDGSNYEVIQTAANKDYVNPNALVNKFNVSGLITPTYNDGTPELIHNVKKGILPSTGGTGIALFLTVGTLLMGGSYLWFRRSKDSAEV